MSGQDDGFLARWSRKKQEVRGRGPQISSPGTGEAESAQSAEPGVGGDAPLHVSNPHRPADASRPLPGRERKEEEGAELEADPESAEPLPSIESLTAESDISAFLRKGVPEVLKNAALRRAWSLDPAIRDFASPAEYAWDFNAPGSMAGFGQAAASVSDKIVSYSLDPSRAAPERPAGSAAVATPASATAVSPALATAAQPPDPPPRPSRQAASAATECRGDPSSDAPPDAAAGRGQPAPAGAAAAKDQGAGLPRSPDPHEPSGGHSEKAAQGRHGGALPR